MKDIKKFENYINEKEIIIDISEIYKDFINKNVRKDKYNKLKELEKKVENLISNKVIKIKGLFLETLKEEEKIGIGVHFVYYNYDQYYINIKDINRENLVYDLTSNIITIYPNIDPELWLKSNKYNI